MNRGYANTRRRERVLSAKKAIKSLAEQCQKQPKMRYAITLEDLLSLFIVLAGKDGTESHVDRVRMAFPCLMD